MDLEANPWIQDQDWRLVSVVGCPLPLSAEIGELAGSLLPLVSIASWVVSLNPAVQLLSKIWIVGHQVVHMHDIWFSLGMALYLVRHWSRFRKHKPGFSVGVMQLASLSGVGSPDPFTTTEWNYSGTWELGTPKGLSETVLNSKVVLFLRSISM